MVTTTSAAPARSLSNSERAPTLRQFGRWRPVRYLSSGDFSEVYFAQHTVTGRVGALKVLSPSLVTSLGAKQRFLVDAHGASMTQHESLVTVYDGDITPDGTAFLVMQFLEGTSLAERLREGPLDLLSTCRVGAQIAGALGAAHTMGLPHGDVKPTNILLLLSRGRGGAPMVKVLGFGNGALIRAALSSRDQDLRLGTPTYMAPEQWLLHPAPSPHADIYALGVLLYRCLAGHAPWSATSSEQWTEVHVRAPVPELPPSCHAPTEVRALLRGMLAKRKEDRPSAEAVARTLGAVIGASTPERALGVGAAVATVEETAVITRQGDAEATVRLARPRRRSTQRSSPRIWLPWAVLALVAVVLVGMRIALAHAG